jgi:hypothetical protein
MNSQIGDLLTLSTVAQLWVAVYPERRMLHRVASSGSWPLTGETRAGAHLCGWKLFV